MKFSKKYIPLLIVWFWCINLNAGKMYTWTDENGIIHITENPPPRSGRLEEVIEYTPKTEKEIQEIRHNQDSKRKERLKQAAFQDAQKARKRADETKIKAEDAKQKADVANQRVKELKKKVGYDTDRIKRNRSAMRKLESEALKAMELARQAAEEASLADEQAKAAEERAMEIINQNRDSNTQPQKAEQ